MKSIFKMFKDKGFIYVINRIRIRIPFLLTTKLSLLKADYEWVLYNKYAYKYRKVLKEHNAVSSAPSIIDENKYRFWMLWLQGEENAPQIVKRCISQVRTFYGDKCLIVLNNETIKDYIQVPDYILYKHERGYISHAHFSDIVRTLLLCEYGGCWIDSTCYMSAPLPDSIFNSKLFVFRMPVCFPGAIKASNWLIVADKSSIIMNKLKELLMKYWMTHNHLEDYLLYHIFFSIVVDSTEKTKEEWNAMPYYNNDNPHILGRELFNRYNHQRVDEILKMCFVHKLSWHLDGKCEKTVFEYLINI